jgi:FAD/FMN-containing dehydrogenase
MTSETTDLSPAPSPAVQAAAQAVREQLGPQRVLLPGPAYDEALPIWNGAVPARPAAIVRCTTAADVQDAVRAARSYGLPLSVRGGGHDWAGRALRHDGLVIDLTGMREVTVDPAAGVADCAGGATATDVISAVEPYGLAFGTGTVGAVGVAGLALGGGYGPISGRVGIAADNLLGADVVLADGRLVRTDAESEPELFWALRGGGGNFGVVTALRVRLHPITTVLAGFALFPWDQAATVMAGYARLIADAPDELTAQVGVLSGPDGGPVVFVSPTWCGVPEDGKGWIDRVEALGAPLMSQIGPMPYSAMLGLFDPFIANGRHYSARTRNLSRLTPAAIAALVAAGETRTSPFTAIMLHRFHGAATRVPVGSTAFGLRDEHLQVELVAAWEPGDATAHQTWVDEAADSLTPYALPGGYPNLLGPDDHAQIALAYGPNTDRLRAAKARLDPEGVFSATPLPD